MISPRTRFSPSPRGLAYGHVSDAQLSDILDDVAIVGSERAIIEAHLADCPACAGRKRGLEAVIALGTLERLTTRPTPDQWPIIAACTVLERRLQPFFARRARRRIGAWVLFAVLSGILLTQGLRQAAAAIARGGALVAAGASSFAPPLGQLSRIREPTPPAAK